MFSKKVLTFEESNEETQIPVDSESKELICIGTKDKDFISIKFGKRAPKFCFILLRRDSFIHYLY